MTFTESNKPVGNMAFMGENAPPYRLVYIHMDPDQNEVMIFEKRP